MSQQINLFNPAFQKQTTLFSATSMAAACGVLVLGLAGMAGWAALCVNQLQAEANNVTRQTEGARKRLAAVSAEFTPREKDPALAGQLLEAEQRHAALEHVAEVIQRGELGNTQGYAEYFRALARQSVDGLWLTGVSIGGAGREIGVQGRALDAAMVPGYLGRLRNEAVLQGKAVGSLQIGEAAASGVTPQAPKAAQAPAADAKGSAPAQPQYVEFSLQSTPVDAKP
jgi:hypothetical protein